MTKPHIINTLISSSLLMLALIQPVHASAEDGTSSENHCKHSEHGNMESRHGGLPPFLKDITLSSTQKEQITAIVEQQKPDMEADFKQRRSLMKEMFSVSNNETFDENQATLLAEKVATLEKNALLNRAKTGHKIFTLLTPEQRKQVAENMQAMEAKPTGFKGYQQRFLNWIKS